MKIIHCSDIHLEATMTSRLSVAQAKQRRAEIKLTLEKMLDYAREKGIGAVLVCGDLFDKSDICTYEKKYIIDLINKFNDIEFFVLSGNHDLKIFDDSFVKPQNAHFFNKSWSSFCLGDINILGKEALDSEIYNPPTSADKYNIVLLHGDIAKNDAPDKINILRLKNKNINYLALGHIHSFFSDTLDDRGVYAYSGCLEGRGFDETGDKGFVVLDTKTNKLEFVKFNSRCFWEYSLEATDKSTLAIKDQCAALLNNVSPKDFVRIKLVGDVSQKIDVDFVQTALLDRCEYLKIIDQTRLVDAALQNAPSLRTEFVSLVNAAELCDDDKAAIIGYGIDALAGKLKK